MFAKLFDLEAVFLFLIASLLIISGITLQKFKGVPQLRTFRMINTLIIIALTLIAGIRFITAYHCY